jgi:hypothetical protein
VIEDAKLMAELLKLPLAERLELARFLSDSAVNGDRQEDNGVGRASLLSLAGRYAGGPGNSSLNDESILEAETGPVSGLSVR